MVVPAYAKRYGVTEAEMREALAHIASKNHFNGARNPRAQFRKEVSEATVCAAAPVAGMLGIFDCSGVADGSAAAIVVRAEDAYRYTDKPIFIKALSFIAGNGNGLADPAYDYTTFPDVAMSAKDAYAQAGITSPRDQIAMAEVHDCFTPTELVLMEDLGFAERGTAYKEVLAGTYDLDGDLPINPDGGLKSFGHPIGTADRGLAPHPQPQRLPRRDGLVHLHPGNECGLSRVLTSTRLDGALRIEHVFLRGTLLESA